MAEPGHGGTGTGAARSREVGSDRPRWRAGLTARFAGDARGTTTIEYALIGSLIFVVVVGSLRYYGSRLSPIYERVSSSVAQGN